MYLTQNAQILSEHMPWNHENHLDKLSDKNPMKKWSGQVGSEVSDQVNIAKKWAINLNCILFKCQKDCVTFFVVQFKFVLLTSFTFFFNLQRSKIF